MRGAYLEAGGPAPPSVLPDISPSRGEIGSFDFSASSSAVKIGEAIATSDLPLEGEMPGRAEGGADPPTLEVQQGPLDHKEILLENITYGTFVRDANFVES
ncbi:hypothetical protein O7A70_22735 [Mesorhizobium sp. Cs1299R1N1]|uniref:hypothetical protein n=1 Tax=Mesorhizobium sp. Cs1299R1N1 TaxID=3015172 RepID=UPI00301CA89A